MNTDLLLEAMRQHHLDAIIVTSPENTGYFADFSVRTQTSIRDRLVIGLITASGDRDLLVCDIEESLARSQTRDTTVHAYVEFRKKPVALLCDILRERGLSDASLGIEYRHLAAEDFLLIRELLSKAKLTPIDEMLDAVRAIKSVAEIQTFRDLMAKTEQGLIAAWSAASLGDTEQEIDSAMRQAFVKAGADGTRHCTIAAGRNAVHAHHTSSKHKLALGEIVRTDFGAVYGRYGTDMARMGVGGAPSSELDRFYRKTYDIHLQLADALQPGTRAGDIYLLAEQLFSSAGIAFDLPHVGHSLRNDGGHENPIMHPLNDQLIKENMLIALEPIPRTPDGELCGTEDVFLITRDGPEALTGASDPSRLFPIG